MHISSRYKLAETSELIVTQIEDAGFQDVHPLESTKDSIEPVIPRPDVGHILSMPDSIDDRTIPSILNMMGTPVLLAVQLWAETDARRADIVDLQFPQFYFTTLVTTFAAILLRTHQYFRGDFVFTIRLNSTQFHQGLLRWYTIPLHSRKSNSVGTAFSVGDANILSLDGEWMNASESNTVVLKQPWLTNWEFIPLRASDFNVNDHQLFSLCARVVSPLIAAASASPTVEVSIFVHIENPVVAVRTVLHELPSFVRTEEDYVVEEQTLEGAVSGLFSVATGALETYNAAVSGNIFGAITAGQKTLKGVSTVSDNLDRPLYTEHLNLIQRTNPVLAHGDGPEGAVRMGLEPQETHTSVDDRGSLDEMDVRQLAQTFGIITTYTWRAESSAGFSIGRIPCHYLYSDYTQDATNTIYCFIPLTYAAVRYVRAKGGLILRLKVVGTAFHKGRLMISYHPHKGDIESNITDNTAVKNVVFDYSAENNEFDFHVPYYAGAGWKELLKTPDFMYRNSFDPTQVMLNQGFGQLNISVANSLTITNNINNSVEIIVMIAGAPDIDFASPGFGFPVYRVAYTEVAPTKDDFLVVAQANESTIEPSNAIVVSKDQVAVGSCKDLFHGDTKETHLKTLLRRKCLIQHVDLKDNAPAFFSVTIANTPMLQMYCGVDITHNTGLWTTPQSHQAWWSIGFLLWSGPMSYTVFTNFSKFDRATAKSTYFPIFNRDASAIRCAVDNSTVSSNNACSETNVAADVVNLSHLPAVNASIPFTTTFKNLPVIDGESYSLNGNGNGSGKSPQDVCTGTLDVNVDVHGNTDTNPIVEVDVYQACGDSFLLWKFLGMPYLVIATAEWNASNTY